MWTDPTTEKAGSGYGIEFWKTDPAKKSVSHQIRIPNTAEPHHFKVGSASGENLEAAPALTAKKAKMLHNEMISKL
jgi:hypothetical protein